MLMQQPPCQVNVTITLWCVPNWLIPLNIPTHIIYNLLQMIHVNGK